MTKEINKFRLYNALAALGFTFEESRALRRIEITLQRWGEGECGNSNDYCSWCISRDEETGLPYRETHPNTGKSYRVRIADKEAGALRRLAAIVGARNARKALDADGMLIPYHQGDPRGCALYLVKASDLVTKENQIIRKAREYGAQLVRGEDYNRVPSLHWVVGTSPNGSVAGSFNTEELAAEAFLRARKCTIPARFVLPIDAHYTRGLAVCC